MESLLTLSTLYRREYLITIEEDDKFRPFQVIFRALSFRDLEFIRGLTPNTASNEINLYVLEKSLVRFINVYDEHNTPISTVDLSLLSTPTKLKLTKIIFQVSSITAEIISKINTNVTLAMDSKFTTDTWKCELCREKGIDALRNCKFREDYDKVRVDDFEVIVGTERFDHCPVFHKDDKLISDIFTSYYSYDKGVFPELGGIADQTEFFMFAVNAVKKAISEVQEKKKQ